MGIFNTIVTACLNCLFGPPLSIVSVIRTREFPESSSWDIAFDEGGVANHVIITREQSRCTCYFFREHNRVCRHMTFIVSTVLNRPFIAEEMRYISADMPIHLFVTNFDDRLQRALSNRKTIISIKKGQAQQECPICLDIIDNGKVFVCRNQCQAQFHKPCIHRYMLSKPPYHLFQCPMCRYVYYKRDITNEKPFYLKRFKGIIDVV